MNGNFNTRMILTTAVFAALLVGPASASVMDQPDAFERAAARAMATHPATPGALQPAVAQALVDELDPAIRTATAARTALKVDQAVAAANEAYDTYRDKTATAARKALGISGDSVLMRSSAPQTQWRPFAPQALTRSSTPQLPTRSSASDGVDWAWLGLGVGMTALLAAGIAGVVLTTRRRGDIALP